MSGLKKIDNSLASVEQAIMKCLTSSGEWPSLVIFSASWLNSTEITRIVIEKIRNARPDTKIYSVELDEIGPITIKYRLKQFPTLFIIHEHEIKRKWEGVFSKKDVLNILDQYIFNVA